MKLFQIKIKPQSAFGNLIQGDSLFGQLCWSIVEKYGEKKLEQLLSAYQTKPFVVVSNAFPTGYLPKPALPFLMYKQEMDTSKRKEFKKKKWIAVDQIQQPVSNWMSFYEAVDDYSEESKTRTHVNQMAGKATGNEYSAFSFDYIIYRSDLDIYVVLDEGVFSIDELTACLKDIGSFGYGKDANVGFGKFEVVDFKECLFKNSKANAYLTLATCVPEQNKYDVRHSFYKTFVRFGKHGHKLNTEKPFKIPVLMADYGAILTPNTYQERLYVGEAVVKVSLVDDKTVQQGYSPVVPVYLDEKE